MLPLDVANSRFDYGFEMHTFWMIVYMLIAIMTTILIPFSIFLYESDDEKSFISRISTALCYTIISFLLVCLLF